MKAFSDWRGYDSLPVSRIYLQEYETEMLASAFETGYVDLVTTDPADSFHIDYGGNNEAWYYDTSIMQYIGFNTNSGFLSRSWARRAISLAVNRDHIAEAFMSGCARVSTIPINPVSGLWNSEINEINAFSLQTMSTLLYENGVEDHDNDGLLEYMVNGVPISFTIDFIVSEENENRLEAARYITATLRNAGFDINLRELSWDEYIKALKNGDFDMFYGETRLTSDFDLSALLSPGGDLNFTGVSDTNCQSLISAFLSAEDLDKSGAADNLYEYLSESSLIAPVLFRQQIVLTRRGAVKGALPTQQNIFNNISEWTIITD